MCRLRTSNINIIKYTMSSAWIGSIFSYTLWIIRPNIDEALHTQCHKLYRTSLQDAIQYIIIFLLISLEYLKNEVVNLCQLQCNHCLTANNKMRLQFERSALHTNTALTQDMWWIFYRMTFLSTTDWKYERYHSISLLARLNYAIIHMWHSNEGCLNILM